jgi:hypothetical protein
VAFDIDETKITIPIHGAMIEMTVEEAQRVYERLGQIFGNNDLPAEGELFNPRRPRGPNWG